MKHTTGLAALALAALAAQAAVTAPSTTHTAQALAARSEARAQGGISPAPSLARAAASPGATAAAPTVDDVGDIDSFGRTVRWLGVQQANIELLDACPPDPPEGFACQPLAPAGTTVFAFEDVARFVLPAKASRSLLCHWFSPLLTLDWDNPGAAPVLGTLAYSPTLTVENPVLDDPALIDPQTGLPFGGRLLTGMSASERLVAPLAPGMAYVESRRDSATCIAGFVSRRALVDSYGLSPALADEFFRQPTTVRLNVRGTATHLAAARLVLGLRIVGD
jgi:hypothetical protein